MARESKRRREERRFGRAERLADLIVESYGGLLHHEPGCVIPRRRQTADMIEACSLVEATNVGDYFRSLIKEKPFDFIRQCPCLFPPFDCWFTEMHQPNLGGMRTGWLYFALDRDEGPAAREVSKRLFPLADHDMIDSSRWTIIGSLVIECARIVAGPIADVLILVDDEGRLIERPQYGIHGTEQARRRAEVHGIINHSLAPSLLAISFMNCKNVTVTANDPGAAVNRERRKGGLKPFLRYHTINIQPMKEVLKTEGDIESNGLARALHICRGHFATYTEEKPLFGRSGAVGRFWVPSHVRGNHKSGVVVSDYRVGAPPK